MRSNFPFVAMRVRDAPKSIRYLFKGKSLRMYPGEVVLESLAAVGGKALPDVGRAGVLGQVPERKRRLPGTVRPRDNMAYRSRLFAHSFDIIPNPRRMRRAMAEDPIHVPSADGGLRASLGLPVWTDLRML